MTASKQEALKNNKTKIKKIKSLPKLMKKVDIRIAMGKMNMHKYKKGTRML